jgi:hypothetical protein
MLPFTGKVRSTYAQLVRTQVRVQHHVVVTQHTPDTTHTPIEKLHGLR